MPPLPAIPEVPWTLFVNDVAVAAGSASPERMHALAVGRLFAEGYVERIDQLHDLDVAEAASGVRLLRARTDAELASRATELAAHRRANGCGLLHFVSCDPLALRVPRTGRPPGADPLRELFRALFAVASDASEAGGLHAAALTDGASMCFEVHDVSRHNAVDKTLGGALMAGTPPDPLGLVLTGRITGEIALKAARAGVSWIASRSIATTLAVALAERAGLSMIGRAVSGAPVLYSVQPPAES
jgi:formate dehydrogenase accessory protein FdhD